MRIALATPLYPPEVGGPATYTEELEKGLGAYGIEVEVIKFRDVRNYPKVFRHYRYYRNVLKAARSADVVFALDPVSVGLPALKAAQKARKPFVVKIVGDYAWEQGRQRFGVTEELDDFVKTPQSNFFVKQLQAVQTRVAKNANNIIVPSPYLKEIVCSWGIPSEKIEIIYNAIDIRASIPLPTKGAEFLVVSAGRRVPWKGFEAIERVGKRHPQWRVEIISGRPREEVLGWMKIADVFVLNSTYEGFPHALIEAMTLGTPVVAANTEANRFVVGDSAHLVEPQNETALEEAIMDVERNPAAARERARIAQSRMDQFSLPQMLSQTAKLFTAI